MGFSRRFPGLPGGGLPLATRRHRRQRPAALVTAARCLLRLMAQAGLPVPAVEAEFPLSAQVLADIGDYQSIRWSF